MAKPKKLSSGRWFIQFKVKGIRKSSTFDTSTEAKAWETKERADIIRGVKGEIPDKSFGDLLKRYADEVSSQKRGEKWERVRIGLILRDDLARVKLDRLNETHIAAWRDRRLKSVSPASVRREWNLLSNACNIAIREWKWLKENPFSQVRRPPPPESRDRLFSCSEIESILVSLGWEDGITPDTQSAKVAAVMLFALESGMRCGEICSLTWGDVGPTVAEVRKGKTRAATRRVPLTRFAQEIIESVRGLDPSLVFALNEAQVDALFRKARDRCGIVDLHFHDSRATAITRLAKRLDILDLARMIGHRDLRMLQVYYRETAEDIAAKL